ncbi:MAG: hypothetical protein AB7U82_05090 [Blastocatellales bacterium]
MLMDVCRLTILLLLIGVTTAAAQEPEKKPESISTEPKLLVAELKTTDGKAVNISGEAVFTIDAANSDDTMSGKLSYAISNDNRQEIARVMNKPLREIPESVTVNDVTVGFVKKTSCPDLKVELFVTKIEIAGAKAHIYWLELTFRETSQDLSRLLCHWARSINVGRCSRPVSAVNRFLKGEKEER